jgi:hypothetical protein
MCPLIVEHARYAPKHTERLDGAGGFRIAHIFRFPAEAGEDARNGLSRALIITANEHGGSAAGKFRLIHKSISDAIECLYQFGRRKQPLRLFHQRMVEVGEKGYHPVYGRAGSDGIRGVDHDLPGKMINAGEPDGFFRDGSADSEHNDFTKPGGIRKAAGHAGWIVLLPFCYFFLRGVSGSEQNLVSFCKEGRSEGLPYRPRPDYSYFHNDGFNRKMINERLVARQIADNQRLLLIIGGREHMAKILQLGFFEAVRAMFPIILEHQACTQADAHLNIVPGYFLG